MPHVPRRLRLLILIALPGVLAACVAGPEVGAITSPYPTSAATVAAATPQPSPDCYGVDESADGPPATVANLMPYVSTVVVAKVTSVEPGTWNTKDGTQPAGGFKSRAADGAEVVTPFNLEVTDVWLGEAEPGGRRIVTPGGTAGCVEWHVNPAPNLRTGKTYVFLLRASSDADRQPHPELPIALAAWPVDASGRVETAEDGSLTLAELEDLVHRPVAPPATPQPTPAGSDRPG